MLNTRVIKDFYDYDDFHHNCNGSTQISDLNASIIHHIEYMPFGENYFEMKSTWEAPYKFNGKEKDEETGFYYYGARYYAPELSIWLSVDPLSDKYPNSSPFAYCLNNPIKFVDPDGNYVDDPPKQKQRRPGQRNLYQKIFNKSSKGHDYVRRDPSVSRDNPFEEVFQEDDIPKEKKMPLERLESIGDGIREFRPRDKNDSEGNIILNYNPGVNEKGNPVEVEYEIGIMGENGETIIDSFSTDKPGSATISFELQKGEHIFVREKSKEATTSSTNISATKTIE